MEYRSQALIAATSLAASIGKYPSVPACVLAQPGPECLELAGLCAGKLPLTYLPGFEASELLQTELLFRARRSQEAYAVFTDYADRTSEMIAVSLAELPAHAKLIIAAAPDAYMRIHKALRSRTSGHIINVPPISERREDVGPLLLAALSGLQSHYQFDGISQEAWDVMISHEWTDTSLLLAAVHDGALHAYLEREKLISLRHLPEYVLRDSPHGFLDIPMSRGWDQRTVLDSYVLHVVARSKSKREAARRLGITTQGLYARLARLTGLGRNRPTDARPDRPNVPVRPPPATAASPAEAWERVGSGGPRNVSKGYSRTFGAPHTDEQHRHMQEEAALALRRHAEAAERAGKDPEGRISQQDLREARLAESDAPEKEKP